MLCSLVDYFNVSVDYLLGKPQWTDEEKPLAFQKKESKAAFVGVCECS